MGSRRWAKLRSAAPRPRSPRVSTADPTSRPATPLSARKTARWPSRSATIVKTVARVAAGTSGARPASPQPPPARPRRRGRAQRDRAAALGADHGGQKAPAFGLSRVARDRVGGGEVTRDEGAEHGPAARQLLHDHGGGGEVETEPAVVRGHQGAEHPELGETLARARRGKRRRHPPPGPSAPRPSRRIAVPP